MLSNINSAITVLLRTVMWMQIDNISLYCLLAYILNQSKITVVSYMMWLSFSHMDIQTQNRKQYGCSFIASLLNSFPRACATPCHTKLGIVITMETTTQTKMRIYSYSLSLQVFLLIRRTVLSTVLPHVLSKVNSIGVYCDNLK